MSVLKVYPSELLFLLILENLPLCISAKIKFFGYSLFKNYELILAVCFIRVQPSTVMRRVWLRLQIDCCRLDEQTSTGDIDSDQ